MKNILILGATGFIGKELTKHLKHENKLYIISRNTEKAKKLLPNDIETIQWDYKNVEALSEIISKVDVVVNLAGENIASGLWTKKQKQKILNSRVNLGHLISEAIRLATNKPEILVQASAVGYYGYDSDNKLNEENLKGKGFLADVTQQWEKSTEIVEQYGVKRIIIRTGVVLGKSGGMFSQLVKPIRLFVGSNFGKGENWIPWIHLDDEIAAIDFLIKNKNSKGIYNLVAPEPQKAKKLNKLIAKKLKRPIWFNIPKFILIGLLGDMAKELLLASQNAIPEKLLKEGFNFKYSNLEDAVQELLK